MGRSGSPLSSPWRSRSSAGSGVVGRTSLRWAEPGRLRTPGRRALSGARRAREEARRAEGPEAPEGVSGAPEGVLGVPEEEQRAPGGASEAPEEASEAPEAPEEALAAPEAPRTSQRTAERPRPLPAGLSAQEAPRARLGVRWAQEGARRAREAQVWGERSAVAAQPYASRPNVQPALSPPAATRSKSVDAGRQLAAATPAISDLLRTDERTNEQG
jgi:hypothetical protein